jgi:DNA-binding Lrp family transcriptional regulator
MAELSRVDQEIVALLREDARMSNASIAARVGIAPSTCHGRMLALRRQGIIRGFHADVDTAKLGRPLQAMIAVRLNANARSRLAPFAHRVAQLPEVLNVYFLAGADDFQIHIATRDTTALRDFVLVHLSERPEVASTVTNLIFDHLRGRNAVLQ